MQLVPIATGNISHNPNKESVYVYNINNQIKMQQLQTIFWERNSDISSLKQQQKLMKKQDFQERERIRTQRENWILKIIKTIKVLTPENKKNIYATVLRMMSYYREGLLLSPQVDFENNFTQDLINLFITFYSECGFGDTSIIKKIVRPNNAFIVIDLIKQLVETHRQFFKVKLLQTYKEAPKLVEDKSKTKFLPLVISRRELPATEPSEAEEGGLTKKELIQVQNTQQKLKPIMYEKWQSFVHYNLPSEQILKTRINDSYLELLERNNQNNFMIHKFQEKCYGKSQTFAYNVSGLYTQEEIKRMQNKLKSDVKEKFAQIRELNGDASADQLKEYFKIKLQIQDNYDKIESKKLNSQQINSWVPIVLQKSGLQHNPLNVYVLFAKELVPIHQFHEKCGISLKNMLKMILKSKIQELKGIKQINEMKNFKRHHFFDLNHAKKKQLMTDQHRVYQKNKKESIFPMLRSNELRQQTEIAIKNRSMSEYKLIPIFKNDLITRRLEVTERDDEVQTPSLQLLKSQQQSKISVSSRKQSKQWPKNKDTKTKSKIDNIIDLIINQRNLTLAI